MVREAEHAAAEATPAEDAEPLAGPETGGSFGINSEEQRWDSRPGRTEIGVLRGFAAALGETLREAQAAGRKLYGFAEHDLVSTFLGTSGGLRLRYDQPTGRVELNAKSADLTRSAWAGAATRDFTDVDIAGLDAGLSERLDWAKRSISLPAGRYETLLPPTAVSDLMIYLYWSAGAKDAADGRTVFSKAGGGTRVGEQLSTHPVTLSSDPQAAGLRCPPFVIAHASGPDSSVFDNGLRLRWSAGIQDGCWPRCLLAALGRAGRTSGHARHRQPGPRDRYTHFRGRGAEPGGHDRVHRPRAAADLPVVHPRGRSPGIAAHRPHQERVYLVEAARWWAR